MLNKDDHNRVKFLAAMAVQSRRAMGLTDEDQIKKDALAFGAKAFEKLLPDQAEQESWYCALRKAIGKELTRTRPKGVAS